MTLIIGIRCRDGLVMAADGMSTESAPMGQGLLTKHETENKLTIQGGILWGSSGSVGVRQIVEQVIADNYGQIYEPAWPPVLIRVRMVETFGPPVVQQYRIAEQASLGKGPIPHTNFIFGVYAQHGFHLLNIECNMDGEVVLAPHVATGSAAKVGQALLRRLRRKEWDLRTAEVAAYRTMNDAIHVEPFGIGPPIVLARYYAAPDGTPKVEMIEGADYDRVRDTAMAWTNLEQEVLAGLFRPPGEGPLAEPIPPPPASL